MLFLLTISGLLKERAHCRVNTLKKTVKLSCEGEKGEEGRNMIKRRWEAEDFCYSVCKMTKRAYQICDFQNHC